MWAVVPAARRWLDAANGCDEAELGCRILKVTEEAGEVAGAWIGARGQNPRKGVTHRREDVAAELADVVITALVAIESLGFDARVTLEAVAGKVARRLEQSGLAHQAGEARAVRGPEPAAAGAGAAVVGGEGTGEDRLGR